MKKPFFLLAFLVSHLFAQAQDISIPDANFKAALLDLGIDTNTDLEIQVSEAEAIHYLDVHQKHIEDVTGLEYFINLDTLILNQNPVATIDVSHNVKLIMLMVGFTDITSLDLSQNIHLKHLLCALTRLTTIDLSTCPALEKLYCHQSYMTALDVSTNTNLIRLICEETAIQSLDLSTNIQLKELDCSNTEITTLDLINNTALEELKCSNLSISSLNLTQNSALISIICTDNENLTEICITTDQLVLTASVTNWQKDAAATWSTDCQLTTPTLDPTNTAAAKVVYKVFTITGTEINESNAKDGVYIYLYTDGSRAKIAK